MSTNSNSEPGPPGALDGLRPVLDGWMETLAQVLESMTDHARPLSGNRPGGLPLRQPAQRLKCCGGSNRSKARRIPSSG